MRFGPLRRIVDWRQIHRQLRFNVGRSDPCLRLVHLGKRYRPRPDPHIMKGWIPFDQGHFEEAITEQDPALALDPAMQGLGWDYLFLEQFEQGLESFRGTSLSACL